MLFNKALESKLKNLEEFNRAVFNTKQGLLLDLEGEFKLLDFKNNQFKDISKEKNIYLFNSTYKPFDKLYYSKDSSVHILNSENGEIDSIPFGNADIIDGKIPIYLPLPKKENPVNKSQQLLSIIALAVFLILCGFFIFQFKKSVNY
jgi:hypothetical protein